MSKSIVSLGGGCDAAMILERFGLRRTSLPFDWLWNLDAGLGAVQEMLATDFAAVTAAGSCVRGPHYKWPGEEQVLFRAHPTIAHLHSNPLDVPADFETFCHRAQKFRDLLAHGSDPIRFVYYRQHHEGPEGDGEEHARRRMERLVEESSAFLDFLRPRHPQRVFSLLALFELPAAHPLRTELAPRFAHLRAQPPRPGLSFDVIPPRPEGPSEAVRGWERAWREVLLAHGVMSGADRALIGLRRRRDKLRKRRRRRDADRHPGPDASSPSS